LKQTGARWKVRRLERMAALCCLAYGDQFDEGKLKALPAGSFYTEPPNANHFAMTKDDGVTLYITGTGPTGTVYVNPADDPIKKQ
jgi:hypothetical protein